MNGCPYIPAWLDDAGLPLAEFRIYCDLCRRADNTTGEAWPSYDAMPQSFEKVERLRMGTTSLGALLEG